MQKTKHFQFGAGRAFRGATTKEVKMKNLMNRILGVGMALAAVVTAQAQTPYIKADVPFNFYVGPTAMPQGAYRVADVNHGGVVWIKAVDSNTGKAIMTFSVQGKPDSEAPRLVFHRYGDVYFLCQVWTGDSVMGQAIGESKREKELARNGAAPTLAVIRLALR